MWNKRLIAAFTSGLLAVSLAACGSSSSAAATTAASAAADSATTAATAAASVSGSVTASGSSALLPLVKAASDAYMASNPNVSVTVNGGGSGTGLKQVADGSVDIGDSDVFAEEKLDADVAKTLTDHEVAVITMAPVANKSLGVTNLTTQQLTDIFTAKITNWKEVGGPDKDIVLVTRPSSSGTRALFKKWAIGGAEEASNKALETDDSGTLMQTIKDNDGAIGYVALSYLVNNTDVQAVSIDGVAPTLENTYNGAYKVWGFEHMYTKGDGSAAAQDFIQYITGDAFSSKMEGMGYGVAAKMSSTAVSSHK
jgi:phosphate transport system substrate-binding protein